jgi:hypothetical protein
LIKTEIFVAGKMILEILSYYDGLDKKGVRDIQQDINVLLEE